MDTTDKQTGEGVYTIRIQRDKLVKMHEIAESEHRTLAGEFRVMVDQRIATYDEREAA